jgi:hypothetical protein
MMKTRRQREASCYKEKQSGEGGSKSGSGKGEQKSRR